MDLTNERCEPWLEILDGDAPILFIAPHGGRAGAAAHATLHPKVNDLETADITREIAGRIGAPALINAAMDRNELDCNRLSQISRRAPWMLEIIVARLADMIGRYGQATVLLIHGWNIIEPRIDFGLGLREVAGQLRPPAGAFISASDTFIRGPVSLLAARLRAAQIHPTFGLRYPGAAAQNLVQGFTGRHAAAEAPALRRLAELAEQGVLNALQLEMSVAVRMPGALRQQAIDAIAETFSTVDNQSRTDLDPRPPLPELPIIRQPRRAPTRKATTSAAPPSRVGIEFYDPAAQLGGMVSFDFGPGAAGGRIMILFDGCRVALFTAEGRAQREGNRLAIGSLVLDARPGERLRFHGPAVTVDDGTAYLSVEHALATGRLDPLMQVDATLEFAGEHSFADRLTELDELFANAPAPQLRENTLSLVPPPHAIFGRLYGTVRMNRTSRDFDANFRLGASFTGLGPQKFVTRRMIWASFSRDGAHDALEARALELDDQTNNRLARSYSAGQWTNCELAEMRIELGSTPRLPESINATLTTPDGNRLATSGRPGTFVMLSRPGPDGTRLHTCLGFAEYYLDGLKGAGMYEFSRRVGITSGADSADDSEAS